MKIRKLLLFSVSVFLCARVNAQIGGSQSFDFVNLPVNATAFALGNQNITVRSVDNNHFWQNPASLDTAFDNYLSYNFNPWFADVSTHSLSYTRSHDKLGNFAFGVHYLNYGEMSETDENGNVLGTFSSSEYLINLGYARRFDNFSYGANLKFAHSSLAAFNASALFVDLGGQFIHPSEDFVVGMVFRNVGLVLDKYTGDSDFVLPFDLQVGASYKPKYMPLRFSTTLHRLYRYDIAYNDPNVVTGFDENGEPINEAPGTLDKVTRHLVFGTELLLADGFNIQAGYNFLKRRELQISERKGMVGFSFGFMLRVKTVQVAFARSIDHISGGTNKFTITTDLNMFTKNRI